MAYDIFISYSRKDLSLIEPLVKDIEKRANVKCWIDWNGIESGSQFEDVIIKAIDSVKVVLFFLSENSMNSDYAKLEVNYAYNTSKKVVPIVLDGGSLRGWFLFKFGAVDFIDVKQQRQYDKLINDLTSWCGTEAPTPKPIPKPTPKSKPTPKQQPTPTPIPTKTYKVGDYYDDGKKQGVVFEVTADGQHGKIVSLTELGKDIQWTTDANEQKRLIGANNKRSGEKNMAKVQQIDGWREKYPAFAWCADLGEGWYLPAYWELKKFTLNAAVRKAVNRTLATKGMELADKWNAHWYWSSTEGDNQFVTGEFCAWGVSMYEEESCDSMKSFDFGYVRAVATF